MDLRWNMPLGIMTTPYDQELYCDGCGCTIDPEECEEHGDQQFYCTDCYQEMMELEKENDIDD